MLAPRPACGSGEPWGADPPDPPPSGGRPPDTPQRSLSLRSGSRNSEIGGRPPRPPLSPSLRDVRHGGDPPGPPGHPSEAAAPHFDHGLPDLLELPSRFPLVVIEWFADEGRVCCV